MDGRRRCLHWFLIATFCIQSDSICVIFGGLQLQYITYE